MLVDNKISLEVGFTNGDNPYGAITFKDSLLVGEHADSLDCTSVNEREDRPKIGMVTAAAYAETSRLPYMIPGTFHAEGSASSRGKSMTVESVTWKDFDTRQCGEGKVPKAIKMHSDSSDLVMVHTFRDITLHNVQNANFLYLDNPLDEWA